MKTLHHLLLTSLALGLLTGRAGAEIFPVFEDAAGSVKANTITKAGGTAKTLAISKTSNAYLNFLVSSAEMNPAFISAARLVIFLPKTTPKGVISIHHLSTEWTETLTTPKITAPALGVMIDQIDLEEIPLKADYYIADVTDLVRFWMNNPAQEFGLAIVSDGVANVTLASKEGFTSGHPAFIEIDTFHAIGDSSANGGVRMAAETTDDGFAGFVSKNTNQEFFAGVASTFDTVPDGWQVYDNTGDAQRFVIDTVGNIGVGDIAPTNRLHVSSLGGNAATVAGHVALIQNTSSGATSGLAIQSNYGGVHGNADNFITFFNISGTSLGSIEGNNAGSVQLSGAGSDYAEYLLREDPAMQTSASEIVGVRDGQIVPHGSEADQFMVVTGQAIVAGNRPSEDEADLAKRSLVSFIGQVPVQVSGPVKSGDFILASENGDGTGVAVSAADIPPSAMHRVVGRAWEATSEEGMKTVNTAVGLDQTSLVVPALQRLDQENRELRARLAQLEAREEKRDAQLAAIHALLRSGAKAQALPAALKQDTDAE